MSPLALMTVLYCGVPPLLCCGVMYSMELLFAILFPCLFILLLHVGVHQGLSWHSGLCCDFVWCVVQHTQQNHGTYNCPYSCTCLQ